MSVQKRKDVARYGIILIFLLTIFVAASAIFLWNTVALLFNWVKPVGNPVVMLIPEGIIIGISSRQIPKTIKKM